MPNEPKELHFSGVIPFFYSALKNLNEKTICFFACSFLFFHVQGSHIHGAEMEYRCLSPGTYEITIRIITGCNRSVSNSIIYEPINPCGSPAPVSTPSWVLPATELPVCDTIANLCGASGPAASLAKEYNTLIDTVTFPAGCNQWRVRYASCCSQPGIYNITGNGNQQLNYEMMIDQSVCSRSPQWDFDIPTYALAGSPDTLRFSATDPDGDVIVYSLVDALQNSTTPYSYNPGYSGAAPLNALAGSFGFSTSSGQIYFNAAPGVALIKVRAEEYRNGNLIGYVTREINMPFVSGTVTGCVYGLYQNLMEGHVYADFNQNCVKDAGDIGLPFYTRIQVDSVSAFTHTDANSDYRFWRPNGYFTTSLSSIFLYPWDSTSAWEVGCPVSPNVNSANFPTSPDTVSGLDFGIVPRDTCPRMEVYCGPWRMSWCRTNRVHIRYWNRGTQTANNAYIEVEIPDSVIIDSTSLPYASYSNGVMTFNLGNVSPLATGFISLYTAPICNPDMRDRYLCFQAHIFPDSACHAPSLPWDNSNLEIVNAECLNGTMGCFTIKNTGTGNMSDTSFYVIRRQGLVITRDTFSLASGDSLRVCTPTNGQSLYFHTYNTPGHPWSTRPQMRLDHCDGGPLPWASKSYNIQPYRDRFLYRGCARLGAPYDPNEKVAIPEGVDPQYHYIGEHQSLEYTIHFQNLGTAPAINVIIYDTLPPELDVSTFRPTGGSHNFQTQVLGNGVIRFYFPNINLPDFGSDPAGSEGYITFTIDQVTGNQPGTRIENSGSIYFDFNDPILTNTAFHTIAEPGQLVQVDEPKAEPGSLSRAEAFPNPFEETITIRMPGAAGEVEIFDLMGKRVASRELSPSGSAKLSLQGEAPGIYFYRIADRGKILAAGKVVKY